ncbi:MAG TPA: hypothetical protein DEV81_01685 [Cyanobacteria bacterium UBA11049]|nr:hypothetical protein [Cyanobacteria bacterium UBA11049]
MLTKRDSLKFSLLGMSIIATSLIGVAIPQQLLAAPLKDNSISLNTKTHNSNISYTSADLQSKNIAQLLATRPVDPEVFCQNYPYNSRCTGNGYKPSSQQPKQKPESKKPAEVKQTTGYSIGGRVSTLGFGIEGTKQFTPNFNGRLGVNYFGLGLNEEESDIKYDANLNLFSIAALGDWYPWKSNGFHLTAGVVYNDNNADGTGEMTGSQTFNIGNRTFTVSEVQKLKAKVKYSSSIAPYIGIGYGNPVRKGSQFSFSIDLGVMFTGSPDVDLSSPNEGNFPQLADAIRREEDQLKDDLDKFSVYPVLSLGVSYQF